MFIEMSGGYSGRETPGNIPNPEAKPASADGTAPVTVWESRTPPNNNRQRSPAGRHNGPPGIVSVLVDLDLDDLLR